MTSVYLDAAIEMIVQKVSAGVAEMEAARLEAEDFMKLPLQPDEPEPPKQQRPPVFSDLEEDDFYTFRGPIKK